MRISSRRTTKRPGAAIGNSNGFWRLLPRSSSYHRYEGPRVRVKTQSPVMALGGYCGKTRISASITIQSTACSLESHLLAHGARGYPLTRAPPRSFRRPREGDDARPGHVCMGVIYWATEITLGAGKFFAELFSACRSDKIWITWLEASAPVGSTATANEAPPKLVPMSAPDAKR
jgi:hypothetical protein